MGTVIVATILLVVVGAIIKRLVQDKKEGKSCCGCSGCSGGCAGNCGSCSGNCSNSN